MATARRGRQEHARGWGPRRRRAAILITLAVVLAVGIAGALVLLRARAAPEFGTLSGRWVRLEGGYVLDIRGVAADGKIDVAYLNPNPVFVSKAEAARDGSVLKVFIELRAPGYPGSTYTLAYDPGADQLQGVYFQAAMRQSFDVRFVRMK